MKRRDFLKLAVAVPVAASVPAVVESSYVLLPNAAELFARGTGRPGAVGGLAELVVETLRKRGPQIVDNIDRSNALFERLRR